MKKSAKNLVRASAVAALYVLLTYLSSLFGLSSGVIQLRLSEALCILPIFLAEAIPGLAIGCFFANLFTGAVPLDMVFGTIATLLGAILTRLLRSHPRLCLIPPIFCNTLIIPAVIVFAYGTPTGYLPAALGVFVGECLSCGLGGFLVYQLMKRHDFRF